MAVAIAFGTSLFALRLNSSFKVLSAVPYTIGFLAGAAGILACVF